MSLNAYPVLDHGHVYLEAHSGTDLDVVNAARVSLNKRSEWEEIRGMQYLSDEDAGLINFLMREKHGTPFEHNHFRFVVKAPIFVFREWHRHRIGVSINEMSGRYTELPREFYIPDEDAIRRQTGKPGAYVFEPVKTESEKAFYRERVRQVCEVAFDTYERLLHDGYAKEIARVVLPVNTYSEMWWSCNARSLMAFLSLRNAPTAQREIREYAMVLEDIFAETMPVTHQAFVEGGRVAP